MRCEKLTSSGRLLIAVVVLVGAQRVESQEALRCVTLSSIDRTEVIDERTIAFYLTGRRIYVNTLDRACPNLERERAFSYSTSTGQLCAIDSITVVEDFGGFSRGATCGLGEFEPTDEESLAVLRGELEPIEIEVEEIEVEDGVEEEEGDAASEAAESEAEGSDVEEAEDGEGRNR